MTNVYVITFPNKKQYVGVSFDPHKRFRVHSRSKFAVGRAIRKYGPENSVLEIVFEGTTEECYQVEAELVVGLGTLSPGGYNLRGGGLGGFQPSEETRQLLITYQNTPEAIANHKAATLRLRQNPDYVARHKVGVKESQNRPTVVLKKKLNASEQWSNTESRNKKLQGIRAYHERDMAERKKSGRPHPKTGKPNGLKGSRWTDERRAKQPKTYKPQKEIL